MNLRPISTESPGVIVAALQGGPFLLRNWIVDALRFIGVCKAAGS